MLLYLLTAFDTASKAVVFYEASLNKGGDPQLLTMGPYRYTRLQKTPKANVWVVEPGKCRKSRPTTLRLQISKTFSAMTDVLPEKDYNWIHTRLITWPLPSGELCQGMLFTPENFDQGKKYPLLVNYNDERIDELYRFREPNASTAGIKHTLLREARATSCYPPTSTAHGDIGGDDPGDSIRG